MRVEAFTLLEIMTALVVFSGSMLAYLGYESSVSRVMYQAQSSAIAQHLIEDMVHAIDTMDVADFQTLVDSMPMDTMTSDTAISSYIKSLNGADGSPLYVGPFSSQGTPLNNASTGGFFYRFLVINTYRNEVGDPSITVDQLFFYYYQVTVVVAYPRPDTADGSATCATPSDSVCYRTAVTFLKGTR